MRYGRFIGLGSGLVVLALVVFVGLSLWQRISRDGGLTSAGAQSLWTCSMHPQIRRDRPGQCPICGMDLIKVAGEDAPKETAKAHDVWTCSMDPQVRTDKSGQCPICGMDLIRAKAASASAVTPLGDVADVETAPVTYRELAREIRTVGKLDYNERRVADITARIAGRVERLYADFTGIQVKEGDHLVDIYSPQLYQAQSELLVNLTAYDKTGAAGKDMAMRAVESARTKLTLWGITQEQIAEIERTRKFNTYLTIYAPIGGTVIEKSVRAGQYVKEGDLMYRIADLDPIWLYIDIYEYDMGWVRYGQAVDITLEAFPGETFRGTVTFIEPSLDDRTRTVKVRVNLANPDKRLKPAMYASAVIRVGLTAGGLPEATGIEGKYWCPMHPEVVSEEPGRCRICGMALERVPQSPATKVEAHADHDAARAETAPGKVLSVPVSAVLDTGRRTVVYRKSDRGYELVDIEVGTRAEARDEAGQAGAFYPVLKGLKAGDQVVLRGAFLLDSQRQIEGMPSLLYPEGQSAANLHAGHGATEPSIKTKPLSPGGHQH